MEPVAKPGNTWSARSEHRNPHQLRVSFFCSAEQLFFNKFWWFQYVAYFCIYKNEFLWELKPKIKEHSAHGTYLIALALTTAHLPVICAAAHSIIRHLLYIKTMKSYTIVCVAIAFLIYNVKIMEHLILIFVNQATAAKQ